MGGILLVALALCASAVLTLAAAGFRGRLGARQAELERAVEELETENQRVQRLHDFVACIDRSRKLAALGRSLLEDLCELTGADAAALFLTDARGGTGQLWLASTNGLSREELPGIVRPGVGLPGRAALQRSAVSTSHVPALLRMADPAGPLEVRHELHVPILRGQELVGVASLMRSGERPFGTAVLAELEQVMPTAAAALAGALALRSETEDATELSRAILDSAQDAYVATDRWGTVEAWSRQATALFGYTEAEAIGRGVEELLLPAESRAEHRRRHDRVFEGALRGLPPERFELWVRDREGNRLLVELSMALARRSGGRPLVAYFARDVTEQREAERLKGEFFALVSHELRTPLTSLIGYLEIVRDEETGAVSQVQRRYLNIIQRNSERLMRLVNDLLFVAQAETGNLLLERGPVDLGTVVCASIEAAQPRAERRSISLSAEVTPIAMEGGDAERLGQLIDNLLANALKFTPAGGRVTARLTRADPDRALLEVSDTGIGIARQDQEHLFERFFRAGAASRAVPGIGLGLSICKAIAEGHGGSIAVESEEGRGATFRIELPLGRVGSGPLVRGPNII